MIDPPIALVMAGGDGTRMRDTHPDLPKPLVPVLGIPLLDLVVRRLVAAGIRDVRFALRHGATTIIEHVRTRPAFADIAVDFVVEHEPRGTIGSLAALARERRTVVVANGDLLSAIDVAALVARHRAAAAELTIATHDEHHRLRLGEVISDNNGVVHAYHEKPTKTFRISSGTYVFEPSVIDLIPDGEWTSMPALVQRAIGEGRRVVEFHHHSPWHDVNDGADLAHATAMLRDDPTAFGVSADELSATP